MPINSVCQLLYKGPKKGRLSTVELRGPEATVALSEGVSAPALPQGVLSLEVTPIPPSSL